jgi:hypothetical protein
VVEDIEELASEPQAGFFGDSEDPLQGEIRLRCIEAAQHVASEIALAGRICLGF